MTIITYFSYKICFSMAILGKSNPNYDYLACGIDEKVKLAAFPPPGHRSLFGYTPETTRKRIPT